MKFKVPALQLQLKSGRLHPDIVKAANDFDNWSRAHNLPEPLVTDISRTKLQLAQFYFDWYSHLRNMVREGHTEGMTPEDQATALEVKNLDDLGLHRKAESRASWHCYGCAIDFSGRPYDLAQREEVRLFLEQIARPPFWEFKLHTVVGEVPHFHLGRRDFEFRRRVSQGSKNG